MIAHVNRWQSKNIEFCSVFFSISATVGAVAYLATILLFITWLICFWVYGASNLISNFTYTAMGGVIFTESPTIFTISLIGLFFLASLAITSVSDNLDKLFGAEADRRKLGEFYPDYCSAVLTETALKWPSHHLQDVYDQQNKSTELTTGIFHFFRLDYSPDAFRGSLKVIQLRIDRQFAANTLSEVSETILGFGSLSRHAVGSSSYRKKYHSVEVPTLSRFGHPKTPIVALEILRQEQSKKTTIDYSLAKYVALDPDDIHTKTASVKVLLKLPIERFEVLLRAVENDNVGELSIDFYISGNGIYRKLRETQHCKILFDGEPVRFAEDHGNIFETRELRDEEKSKLSFFDEGFKDSCDVEIRLTSKKTNFVDDAENAC